MTEIIHDANDLIKEMNIYQKMLMIQTELGTVAKNLSIDTGKGKSYKAVSERDVIDAVKPLEDKYHIYSHPIDRDIVESAFLEKKTDWGTSKSFFVRIKTIYEFVNTDNPTERMTTVSYGDGIDTGDKAEGKAMTYADKYALMKMYKISTGDDPDQVASEEYEKKIPSQTQITSEAIAKIQSLYTTDEIQTMLGNLKLSDIGKLKMSQANKMILARTGLNDQTETF